ncbi:MAG: threonylcarbamoyl-AMP synthase [Firmicutes bacterium]|nr:threonylcarbamoyl-AMP synthase [Bacillota bacterium]MBQ6841670.1 threonylcarbamoyl-AMP synthase [Bacillota bacterium]
METKVLPITTESLAEARAIIRDGGLVAFPTETVYGLGADARNAAAVAGIFAAKGRPADNPLIVHICDKAQVEEYAYLTPLAEKLIEAYWPGPITLVLKKRDCIPDIVSAGLDSVGLRLPGSAAAREFLAAVGCPIAAPSANTSGRPSPTAAAHVAEDMAGKVPLILDGGAVEIGLESTVVDARGEYPLVLRPGGITAEMLRELCGGLLTKPQLPTQKPLAPGMKYTHYAPQGEVLLFATAAEGAALLSAHAEAQPLLIASAEMAAELGYADSFIPGKRGDLDAYARSIFAALRLADSQSRSVILVETVPEEGLGAAIMNRLKKSAGVL